MAESFTAAQPQLAREVAHWVIAASRLRDLESLAAREAWDRLERYLGVTVRQDLMAAIDRLGRQGAALQAALQAAVSMESLEPVRQQLLRFRRSYLRTETTLDFYADAINTRTNPEVATLLRACDILARRSMADVLQPLGKPTPLVLTYLDKGLGASILKAGLRLWDGGVLNPAATIKIVRHNLYRPTSLIHEAGHQVAHILGWNQELAAALAKGLGKESDLVAETWAGWASEIAADVFAFVHTGYASVAGLRDVLAGEDAFVFRLAVGDPHPVGYLRVLLGVEMCRQFYGPGPWDDLARFWSHSYALERAPGGVRTLLQRSIYLLPQVADIILRAPLRAFGGRPPVALVDPGRVSPQALDQLESEVGPALFTSPHWALTEPLRLLALGGYSAAVTPDGAMEALKKQEAWMLRLGASSQLALT